MKKLLSYFVIVCSLVVVSIGVVVYSQLTDLENLKITLAHKIGELTQSQVYIGEAILDLDQGIGVKLKNVSLSKSANGTPAMEAQEILVVIKIFPLLFREVVIEKLVMVGSSIKLTRKPDGTFGILGMEGLLAQKNFFEKDITSIIKMGFTSQLIIQESEVEFVDYFERTQPSHIPLKNIRFSIQKAFKKSQFGFSFQGEIPHPEGVSHIALSGKLKNPSGGLDLSGFLADGKITLHEIPLPQFESYLRKGFAFKPGDMTVSLESRFSATLLGPKRFSGNLKYHDSKMRDASAPVRTSVSNHGGVDYKVVLQEDSIIIEEFSFHSGNISLKGSGRLDGYASENPNVAFVVQSNELSRDDIEGFPLFNGFSKSHQQLIRNTLDRGALSIHSLKFRGNLAQWHRLDLPENIALLSGEVGFKQVKWNSSFLDLRQMTGTLSLGSGTCDIEVKKARHNLIPQAILTGKIKDLVNRPIGNLEMVGDLTLNQLRTILKAHVTEQKFQKFLGRIQDVSGKGKLHISFKGPLEDFDQVSANANFSFVGAGYKYLDPANKKKFHQVENFQGNVRLQHTSLPKTKILSPWKIIFEGFSGKFGANTFSGGTGEIFLGKDRPQIKLVSKMKIHATTAGDLFEIPSMPFWKDIRLGYGMFSVDYRLEGRSFELDKAQSAAEIELNNVSMKLKNQPGLWSNLSGRINLAGNQMRFEKIRGRYGDSLFHLDGVIQVQSKSNPDFDLHITSASLSPADLKGIPFLERFDGGGTIQFDSHWSGKPMAMDFRGAINLKNAFYKYGDLHVKGVGVASSLRLAGRIEKGKAVTIKNWVYKIGRNTIEGEGKVGLSTQPRIKFRAHANDLQTVSLGLPILGNNRSGTARFDVSGSGIPGKSASMNIRGGFELKNLVFEVDENQLTINAKASMQGGQLKILSGNLLSTDSSFQFLGTYGLGSHPTFDLAVSGKKLNLNTIGGPPESSPGGVRSRLENSKLFANGAGRLVFDLKRLDYKFSRLKNVRGEVSLKNKTFKVNKVKIVSQNKNLIQGNGLLALADKGFKFQSRVHAENIKTTEFLDQFGDTFVDGLSGRIKLLRANFQGEGANWNQISRSLDGSLSFHLNSGKINKDKIERGVFHLLGLSNEAKPDTLSKPSSQYRQISGNFHVKKGIAETENFLFKTPKRVTSLVGKFDLAQSEMDAVVGVAPLAALDRFLAKIPVVGKIITAGDEESLVKNYYTVRGNFSSPKVTPIPLTSLGKKLVGIFQGIFQAPQDIINPLP